jgi:uncharacterized protein (TIGR02118 family)
MFASTVCYRPGFRFDLDYYLKRHIPLCEKALRPLGLVGVDVRVQAPKADGTQPPYQVIATLYFESAEAFRAFATSPLSRTLSEDIPNFTDGRPEILAGEVVYHAQYTD